jgi:MFS family permease
MVFATMGMVVLFKAMGSELFPTSYRSTASGVRAIAGVLGAFAGGFVEGRLYEITGSHASAITLMLPCLAVPALFVLVFLPETATRELEDISPER